MILNIVVEDVILYAKGYDNLIFRRVYINTYKTIILIKHRIILKYDAESPKLKRDKKDS